MSHRVLFNNQKLYNLMLKTIKTPPTMKSKGRNILVSRCMSASSPNFETETMTKRVGENPLDHLKSLSQARKFCDVDGFRKPDCHWTFVISMSQCGDDGGSDIKAPILRTINFQRISENGIDFIMKNKGHSSNLLFVKDKEISFLHTFGKYKPGEKVEQWRATGYCTPLKLKEILDHVPEYTVVEMVASVRANKEGDGRADMDVSHFMELVQETRDEFAHGRISMLELDEAMRAWRFVPKQMEKMVGGPGQVMWDRREWYRDEKGWKEPEQLMPF